MQLIPLGILMLITATSDTQIAYPMDQELAKAFHELACEYTGGICPPPPKVMAVNTTPTKWGYHYRGTSTVFISTRCMEMNDWCQGVLIHEMVHYIVSEQGIMKERCVNEQFAWAIFNRFLLDIGRWDITNFGWRSHYKGC